jgi:hypothetical protein
MINKKIISKGFETILIDNPTLEKTFTTETFQKKIDLLESELKDFSEDQFNNAISQIMKYEKLYSLPTLYHFYKYMQSESNKEQHTVDLINKMINATLINRISIKNSNLACFHTTKENKEKLNNLPEDQKQEIRKIVKDNFGIKEIEYIY